MVISITFVFKFQDHIVLILKEMCDCCDNVQTVIVITHYLMTGTKHLDLKECLLVTTYIVMYVTCSNLQYALLCYSF